MREIKGLRDQVERLQRGQSELADDLHKEKIARADADRKAVHLNVEAEAHGLTRGSVVRLTKERDDLRALLAKWRGLDCGGC